MKKTLLALCLFAFIQTSQAQTKEETISWIKEKLEYAIDLFESANINYTIKWDVSECEIKYSCIEQSYNRTSKITIILPINGLAITDKNNERYAIPDGVFISDAKKIIMEIERTGQQKIKSYESDTFTNLKIKESETDLLKRMNKAIKHLATFCVTKKETF